jgi:hypothetical protein
MKCLPCQTRHTLQLGIRQVEQEYQDGYSTRVRRVRISGAALLLALATQVMLAAAVVASLIAPGRLFPIEYLSRCLTAVLCVSPFTALLAWMYLHSRAGAREAQLRLIRLESFLGRSGSPTHPRLER